MEPEAPSTPRAILHVDMDAFFAAVEELDHPELRGKPVIIGGTPEGHGVVSTANYEARKYGIHSAMPASRALKLCPHGTFLRGRHGRYAEISRQIRAIFGEVTPLVEPLSIDEAFLDVTGSQRLFGNPVEIAHHLKRAIRERTGSLTASVGVAPNKFLAKVASDLDKPDGITIVPAGREREFLAPLDIGRLWGVGPRARESLEAIGIHRVEDLQQRSRIALESRFGKEFGGHLFRLSRGLDDRQVEPRRERKSISCETTLAEFIPGHDRETIERLLLELCEELGVRIHREGLRGQSITLKVRDHRFQTITRSRKLSDPVHLPDELYRAALDLLREKVDLGGRKLRLLGIGLGHLVGGEAVQLDLVEAERHEREERVHQSVQDIRDRLGRRAIQRGRLLEPRTPTPRSPGIEPPARPS